MSLQGRFPMIPEETVVQRASFARVFLSDLPSPMLYEPSSMSDGVSCRLEVGEQP
jgi:hypothetical protein